uniref:cytochrome c1-like isoform X2 n=1 Tax=Pristiophorus japonicus TaxID=55135 RepID=UPI00398F372F
MVKIPAMSANSTVSSAERFTQMIWRETTDMGIAYAMSDKGSFVVAQYQPRGNTSKPDSFVNNVLPLDSAFAKLDTTPKQATPAEEEVTPAPAEEPAVVTPPAEPTAEQPAAEETAAKEIAPEALTAKAKEAEEKPAEEKAAVPELVPPPAKEEKKKTHRHCPKKKDPKLKKAERSPCE